MSDRLTDIEILKKIDNCENTVTLSSLKSVAVSRLRDSIKERQELAAQVERLRQAGNRVVLYKDPESDWLQTVSETPPQSLAAVRAEAVDKALRDLAETWIDPHVMGPFSWDLVSAIIVDRADRLQELQDGEV